ncbi:MAG: type II toxin-antitoxin system RelE/ParE family toxin [Gammaproteobacteria bacterium]|nr:type II toxin-antitoxin system RelE/ParE family toxin [Gammaproteobacteria bacterium]
MASYRISEAAKRDLKRIYRRGVLEFGEAQADRYFDAHFERFNEIATQPLRYPAVDDIRAGYRRSACGVDSIYYRIAGNRVEIMRIPGRQDADGWL